jgi:hypothetical protein
MRRRCLPSSAEVSCGLVVRLPGPASLQLVLLCFRSTEAKEMEIPVLRQELRCCAASIHGPCL